MNMKHRVLLFLLLTLAGFSGVRAASFPEWQFAQFSQAELLDPAVSGKDANPAGDGLSNWLKYVFDLDPHAACIEGAPAPQMVGGALALNFFRRTDYPYLIYALEASPDLRHWSWRNSYQPSAVTYLGTVAQWTVTDPYQWPAGVSKFLRLRVEGGIPGSLYYLRARLMNPLTGRFWSADSYEGSQSDPQSLHKYLYCGGDGVNCIDPNGNASLTEVMVTAAIGATIGALVAVNVTSYLNPNVTEDELWKAAEYGAVTGALGGVGFGVKSASLFIQAIRVLTSAGLTLDSGLSAIQAQGEKERKVYAAAAVLGLWGTFTAARPLSVASTQLEFEFVKGDLSGELSTWDFAADAGQVVRVTSQQLQRKFKHAADFGVDGNFNLTNGSRFGAAIDQHINSPSVRIVQGEYRGKPVTHYVDLSTGLNVITDPSGNFISGWKLSPQQLHNVLTTGKLGGG